MIIFLFTHLKILILTALYPPLGASGHDERCRQVVDVLSKRGHKIQVLTSSHRVPPMGVTGEKGVYRQLQLHDVSDKESVLGVSYQATYGEELSHARALYNRIDRFKPDVVYVWNMNGLSKSLLFSLQQQGIAMVYDLHCRWLSPHAYEMDPWYRWWKCNESGSSKLYQAFLKITGGARRRLRNFPIGKNTDLDLSHSSVCSESLRDRLVASGVTQAATLPVIYPALDTTRLLPKRSYTKVRKFMWAGRLSAGKSPATALKAVEVLKGRGIDVSLDFYGMGEPIERKAMRSLIDASGLAASVRMLGIRPGELVTKYTEYDALLFTSRCDDPFPITPLEAMLSGVPCVLASDGGIQEIAEDGVTALLYDAENAEALADAMVRLMDQPDGGEAIGKKCRESLQVEHSLSNMAAKIEALLSAASEQS